MRRAVLALAVVLLPSVAVAQVAGLRGTVVVTNKTPSTFSIIDVESGRLVATLPTGEGPHELALSRDGGTAVVTNYAGRPGNTLTVINVPGRQVLRTVDLGTWHRPHGIVFLPGDSLVAVTSEASGQVLIVAVADGQVRKAVPTTQQLSHMVGVAADGIRAFTGNVGSHTVSELDLTAGVFVRQWAVPEQPEAINVTPDGAEVWVGSNATGKLSVISPATGQVVTAAEGFGWPYRVVFTPDRSTVLVPDLKRQELRFIDRASHRELGRVSLPGGEPQGLALTPDGRFAFQSLSTGARVAVIDVAARAVVGYLPAGETPDGIGFTTRVVAR